MKFNYLNKAIILIYLIIPLVIMDTIIQNLENFKNASDDIFTITELNSTQRRQVHEHCKRLNLCSTSSDPLSTGLKNITVTKSTNDVTFIPTDLDITLSEYFKFPIWVSKELTIKSIKLFSEYFKVPIATYDPQHLIYFIELYSTTHDAYTKFKIFTDAIIEFGSFGAFNSYRMQLIIKISADISKVYQNKLTDIKKKDTKCKELPPTTSIYSSTTNGEYVPYISLDEITANFNSYYYLEPALFQNHDNWADFISTYTSVPFFKQSKHFRQLILGNVGNKKCEPVQKYFMSELFAKLKCMVDVRGKLGTDEMIVNTTFETIISDVDKINKCIQELPSSMHRVWRITPFCIKNIPDSLFFEKRPISMDDTHIDYSTFELKNVNRDYHSQAHKYILGMQSTPEDLLAMKNDYSITQCNYHPISGIASSIIDFDHQLLADYFDISLHTAQKITPTALKIWTTYFNIPLNVFDPSYLIYFVNLYTESHDAFRKFKLFTDALEKIYTITALNDFGIDLADKICHELVESIHDVFIPKVTIGATTNIYSAPINGIKKVFIAINIDKFNFHKYLCPDLLSNSLNELISTHTDIPFFRESKLIKKIALGKINFFYKTQKNAPKWKDITTSNINYVISVLESVLNTYTLTKTTKKGLLIETNLNDVSELCIKIRQSILELSEPMRNLWNVITFTLSSIGKSTLFEKRFPDNNFKIKNIENDKDIYSQAHKYVLNIAPSEEDLHSMKEGNHITYNHYYKFY